MKYLLPHEEMRMFLEEMSRCTIYVEEICLKDKYVVFKYVKKTLLETVLYGFYVGFIWVLYGFYVGSYGFVCGFM
jgi:hypothetical protein